jgi:hypothetical protein
LRELSFIDNERYPKNKPQFRAIIPDSLVQLKKLRYFKSTLNAIKNRAYLRTVYKALPDSTGIELQGFRFKTSIDTTVNLGIYAQYNVGGTVMSGLEFNFLYNPFKIASQITKKGRFKDRAYGKNDNATNPFDFHTFTAGVAWNYLKSFVMGYNLATPILKNVFQSPFKQI